MKEIRHAKKGDLTRIHSLAEQLGYSSEISDFSHRFDVVLSDPSQHVLVIANETVLAWIHFQRVSSLVERECVEIKALVVDESQRGQGLGGELILEVEKWARDHQIKDIRFGSNAVRERAHKLYLSLGYSIYKTSHRFIKTLL